LPVDQGDDFTELVSRLLVSWRIGHLNVSAMEYTG
jgi:hypothetical protein